MISSNDAFYTQLLLKRQEIQTAVDNLRFMQLLQALIPRTGDERNLLTMSLKKSVDQRPPWPEGL